MSTWHDGQFDDPVKNAQYQRRAKNQAHYAKKEAQRQFRKDFAPNAEEKRFISQLTWVTLGVLFVIGLDHRSTCPSGCSAWACS